MKSIKLEAAKILLETTCVQIRTDPPFTYSSGLKGPIYCDNRKLLSEVTKREEMIGLLIKLIEDNKIDADNLMGVATAGIAPAALLASELRLPISYIRTKPKEHGLSKLIEGKVEKTDKILLVEDLVNQGSSSVPLVEYLIKEGHKVIGLLCYVSYEMPKVQERLKALGVPLYALTGLKEILQVAQEKKLISNEDKEIVEKWQKNPENFSSI